MPDAGISIIWGGVAAAAVTAVASFGSAHISRRIKISEFRQAWINDLRKDIADYSGVAEKWFQKYTELRDHDLEHDHGDHVHRIRTELMPIADEALVILRRIKLRFNPRDDNPDKAEDEAFIQSLAALIEPRQLDPRHVGSSWDDLADGAVARAREILKREWEVTKHPLQNWAKRFLKRSHQHLVSGRRQVIVRWGGIRPRLGPPQNKV